MSELQHIRQQLQQNQLHLALESVNRALQASPRDADLLFLRGKIYWRLGNRAAATANYAAAAALDPHSPAVNALENARDIDNFFNPDIFNP